MVPTSEVLLHHHQLQSKVYFVGFELRSLIELRTQLFSFERSLSVCSRLNVLAALRMVLATWRRRWSLGGLGLSQSEIILPGLARIGCFS